jgi:hypothetical protein
MGTERAWNGTNEEQGYRRRDQRRSNDDGKGCLECSGKDAEKQLGVQESTPVRNERESKARTSSVERNIGEAGGEHKKEMWSHQRRSAFSLSI